MVSIDVINVLIAVANAIFSTNALNVLLITILLIKYAREFVKLLTLAMFWLPRILSLVCLV